MMKIVKKYRKMTMKIDISRTKLAFLLPLVLLFTMNSCDDKLDINPESFISSDAFYKNEEEVNLAVIAIYNSLYEMMDLEWNVTEIRSDNTFFRPDGTPDSDTDRFTLDRFTLTPTNRLSSDYYRACYSTIALANRVLENLDVVENTDTRDQYEGEARFLRAHAYFNLVRLYGPLVIVDESISGEEALTLDRSPEMEVYDFILEDLKIAKENLPESFENQQTGRATKWAAQGILAKVYLTLEDYNSSKTELAGIINEGPFELLENYDDVFDVDNEYNSEIIFAVRYQSGSVGLGAPFANYFAPLQTGDLIVKGDGRSYNVPTESISQAYPVNGERKEPSMADFWLNSNDEPEYDKHVVKYNSDFSVYNDSGVDWPVLRYADVLLMMSKTTLETEGIAPSLELLNKVRERAGATPYDVADINSSFAMKLAIEEERRLEFAFENQRWFDLVRTDRAVTVINQHFNREPVYNDPNSPEKGAEPIQEWQLLLPIPQYELDLNPNIAQNIGY
ncbi:RagB/SusD family nutrient uptake outer membrane protein [Salegentibacter echinorum]|nr:RagB/SusD family nutrient uptake outer membrane protein [Salegentibacter echinorum]